MASRSNLIRVLITMRIDYIQQYDEKRNSIDIRWQESLSYLCGGEAVLFALFNSGSEAHILETLQSIKPDLIVISGGNDLGANKKRDLSESYLLEWSKRKNIPVLAICRGMQMMQHFLGGKLAFISEHVAIEHDIQASHSTKVFKCLKTNSFHDYGIIKHELAPRLIPLYEHSDGSVEAVRHSEFPWLGIMWHPERGGSDMENTNLWLKKAIGEICFEKN